MKKTRILKIIQVLLSLLFLTIVYFLILKYVETKHYSEDGFVSGVIAVFCGILYGYLGYKYIRFVYSIRFDVKTQILIVVLCCLFGTAFTFFGMEQLVSYGLSELILAFVEVDGFNRQFGFAYPLLTGILSPTFAVMLYNMLLEKHIKQKMD